MSTMTRTRPNRQLEAMPWQGRYSHLSILILYSTNLPRALQECIGDDLLVTLRRYVYFLQKNSVFRQRHIIPTWCYYLNTKQRDRWSHASPKLHKAYSLIMLLPEPVLRFMDDEAEGLVNTLCTQMINSKVDFTDLKLQIHRCFNLSSAQLMQAPHHLDDEDILRTMLDPTDIIGEEILLN